MKVAYILHDTTPYGGATKAFMKMLKNLMPMGVIPVVVLPNREGIYADLQDMGITCKALTYRESIYSHCRTLKEIVLFLPRMVAKVYVNYRATNHLATFFKQQEIDIVHTNVGVVSVGYRAAQRLGIPHVYHIREYGDLDFHMHYFPNKKTFLRQLNESLSYAICITKGICQHNQLTGKPTARVIYDGAIEGYSKTMPHGGGDYFLFAGFVVPAKGVHQLLQAYAAYASAVTTPLRLLVAGRMQGKPYDLQMKAYVTAHNLNGLVEFLGERTDIAQLMTDARAIVISSRFEGFGLCMPEAMEQGCLAIARNTAGTKEQLDNGLELEGQEIALRYDSTEELAQLLMDVSSQPVDYYQPYIERAFRTVNRLYTAERNAKDIYNFYQFILHERNRQ